MSFLAVNLVLSLIWAALVGVTVANLVKGFVIGFVLLALGRPFLGTTRYVASVLAAARLAVTFLVALVAANVRLARDVLRRRPHFTPAFLRVDLPALGPSGASLLASLVSLTPGSITVDLNEAGDQLYLHTVYATDPERARRSVLALARLVAQAAGAEVARTTTRGAP